MKGKFNKQNAFGVELELLIPSHLTQNDIVQHLIDAGIFARKETYNHTTVTYWKMTTDCTVKSLGRTYYKGGNELVSPKLYGDEGKAQLKKVLEVLNELDCIVNKTCGTHVHHDVTNVMIKDQKTVNTFLNNLIKTVCKFEHIIYRLIAPSRLQKIGSSWWTLPARYIFNQYQSRNITIDTLVEKVKHSLNRDCNYKYNNYGAGVNKRYSPSRTQSDRYCGLNLKNIWTRGSVEFRYHQGTLNFEKLWAWIVFTQAFIVTAENKKSVNFGKGDAGLFYLKKSIGFIGSKDRCEEVKFANKVISKRFKELTTPEMNRRRSRAKFYYTIKEQLQKGA